MSLESSNTNKEYLAGFKTPEDDHAGKLHDEVSGRKEHTLAGSLVGSVRDFIGGGANDETDAEKRAQTNDHIALIAADTVAALPMVRSLTGGLVRAGLLIDPHKSISDNASSFGLNFAEGFALNKVSRLTLPESSLSQFTAAKLGGGVLSESATHLTVGFGFGAVRSGFSAETWKDQNGNLDLGHGVEQVLKSGATGALFNLPAGLIGTRVARASSLMVAENAPARLAQVIAGVGSGYAAGGVFGGLDAMAAGKSWTDVLQGINQGGMVGAFTGGLVSSLQSPHALSGRNDVESIIGARNNGVNSSESWLSRASTVKTANSFELQEAAPTRASVRETTDGKAVTRNWNWYEESPWMNKIFDSIDYVPGNPGKVSEIFQRLMPKDTEMRKYYWVNEGEKGPYKDFDDFFKNTNTGTRNYRVYEVKDQGLKVSIPEDYAQSLDRVRELRIGLEKATPLDHLTEAQKSEAAKWAVTGDRVSDLKLRRLFDTADGVEKAMPFLKLRAELDMHPHGTRALPEDLVPLIDELPNRQQLKQLVLLDEPNYQDPWHRHNYKPTFTSAATADSTTGTVTFYKTNRPTEGAPQTENVIREKLFHEDSHLVPDKDGLFAAAADLEKKGYYISDYSKRNVDENYAEHRGAVFLMPDAESFLIMAEKAPLRTSIIARQLALTLAETPTALTSPYAEKFANRIQFVEDHVVPLAQQTLIEHLNSPSIAVRSNAVKLLGELGTPEQADALKPLLQRGAETKAGQPTREAVLAGTAYDAMIKMISRGKNPDQLFDFLVDEAMPGKPFRQQALDNLETMSSDPRRYYYVRALRYGGDDANTGKLLEEMARMPDERGMKLAFNLLMKQADAAQYAGEFKQSLAKGILDDRNMYWLHKDALGLVKDSLDPKLLPALKRLAAGKGEEGAMATKIMANILANKVELLRNRNAPVPADLIQDLLSTNSNEAISPLLRVAVSSSPTAKMAETALDRFNKQMVKYYAQRMQATKIPIHEKHAIAQLAQWVGHI